MLSIYHKPICASEFANEKPVTPGHSSDFASGSKAMPLKLWEWIPHATPLGAVNGL